MTPPIMSDQDKCENDYYFFRINNWKIYFNLFTYIREIVRVNFIVIIRVKLWTIYNYFRYYVDVDFRFTKIVLEKI